MILRYELDVPPDAVAARLRSAIEGESILYRVAPSVGARKRLVGSVGRNTFEIHVRQQNYNSLAPRAKGSIEETDRGSRVTVELGASRTTTVGLSLLIGATGLGGGIVLVGAGYPAAVGALTAATLLAISWLVGRSGPRSGFPRSEESELHGALDMIFDASRPRNETP